MCSKLILWTMVIFWFAPFINCNLYASDSQTVPNDSIKREISQQNYGSEKQSNKNINEQITLLETQNSLLKEHNQDLLHTIQWALIFASSFLIIFLGFFGILTQRRHEQDKKILQKSLETEVTKARMEIEAGFQQKTKTLEQSINKIAQSVTITTIKPIKKQINSLLYRLVMLEIQVLKYDVKEWRRKGVKANVLSTWFSIAKKGASISQISSSNWITSEALEKMDHWLKQGGKFDSMEITEVVAFLQTLPAEFETLVKSIQKKL